MAAGRGAVLGVVKERQTNVGILDRECRCSVPSGVGWGEGGARRKEAA